MMMNRSHYCLLLLLAYANFNVDVNVIAFTPTTTTTLSKSTSLSASNNNNDSNNNNNNVDDTSNINRRRQLLTSTATGLSVGLSTLLYKPQPSKADIEGVVTPSFLNYPDDDAKKSTITADDADVNINTSANANSNANPEGGVTLYTTKSGLKYIELKEGAGRSPKYGNFLSISYKAYIKLPENSQSYNSKLQEYDSDNSFLIKHGNGRMIPGLDEGLHTMKVGGKRRIIIPPKLGYVGPGVLGPLPETPIGRYKLNKLLDQMVEVRGGNVVFDVELRSVVEDEADQGYYEDDSLTPEQFNTLRINLQQKAKSAQSGFDLLDSV